jgi:hypothetical protein
VAVPGGAELAKSVTTDLPLWWLRRLRREFALLLRVGTVCEGPVPERLHQLAAAPHDTRVLR